MPKKLSNALTPLTVKNAMPGRHADGGGLQLLVKESGSRSWVYRFMLRGKSRDVGLGPAIGSGAVSLAEARNLAAALRLKVKAGVDPLAERLEAASATVAAAQASKVAGITFRAVAEAHIAAHSDGWRNAKHRQQWSSTLATYAYPVIGDLPVADVGTAHVLSILEPIWKAKPETAARLRGRIEAILDAAKARGYREGENPARWRGHVAQILPGRAHLSRGHHKAMRYGELATFLVKVREREAMAALALEFTILTAVRTGEAMGATWSEVDLAKAMWTIPAARTKTGREHRVPLSARAVDILQGLKLLGSHDHAYLFAGNKGKLSSMAMAMLLRRMDVDVTVHGFRSTFRDWAAECTGYAHEVCEMALAHAIGNKAEAAYRRGDLFDKRRRLMDDWATYCANGGAADANVTPIRTSKAG
jgi:integrase